MSKPNFKTRPGGYREDPNYLPDGLRGELMPLLIEGELTVAEADSFLDTCRRLAQMVTAGRRLQTFGRERDELALVSARAKALLEAMEALHVDARESLEILAGEELRFFHRDDKFLSDSWSAVDRLKQLCERAAQQLPPGKSEPDVMVGHGFAVFVVEAFWCQFERLPPADQHGWFVAFMQRLGEHLGLVCGPRPVRKAITEHAHYASSQNRRDA